MSSRELLGDANQCFSKLFDQVCTINDALTA